MAALDTLPPDQRAVLDLVLQRGRSYDDIARLLAIDRAAVRGRALAALDRLGPDTGVPPERRALITDYLLGQLPDALADQTRDRLARSPSERAWARVLASELGAVASQPLPDIPSENGAAPETGPARAGGEAEPPAPSAAAERRRPSSRTGGAIVLGIGVLVVVAVVVVLATLTGGTSKKHTTTSAGAASRPASTATSTGTSTSSAHIVAQSNLNPPSAGSSAKGVAFVVQDGSAYGIIIEAQGVAPNNHNAYAVWLYNSPTDSIRLGFVSPAVGKSGQLQAGSALPANAGHYQKLLLTLETQSAPKTPGTIVLEGPFKGVPAS
jgi:Sigma-70, region 4